MSVTPLLNVYLNANDTAQPLLVSTANNTPAGGVQVVDGDRVTVRLYWVTATGGSPTFDTPAESGSVVLAAKKNPSDTELVYFLDDWTWENDYIEGTLDLATPEGFWSGTQVSKSIFANVEVRTSANSERLTWAFFMQVIRQSYGGGETPPDPPQPYLDTAAALQIFVAYDRAQTLTTEQKAQARENIGASSGSGDVVSDGTITAANSGKVAVITDLKEIGAGVAYGVGTEGSIVIHDSTITMANTTRLAQVSGDSDGMIEAGPVYSQTPTANSIVQCDSSGNIVVSGINSYSAIFTELSVNSYIDCDGYTRSAEFFNDDNSFTVGTDGAIAGTNITANGHFKSQGDGAGGAGHLILAQGTTPNGTGSTTTLWGIANGIGWRNGTGTAYSLTLPTASGTLALVDGNLGTPTTLTLTNATGLPVAGGGTGASTALQARMNLGLTRMSPVHGGDGAWVTATVSGTVGTNTYFGGTRTGQVVSATAGFGRFYYNSANSSNIYTGSRTVVNWSAAFRVDFRALIFLNTNASSKVTFLVATATGTAAHDLAALGLAVQAYGNGTACRIRLQAHNGTTATNGTDVAWTAGDDNFYDFSLVWTPGTGATLYKDDVSLCSISSGLPSGNGASGATCPMFLFENAAASSDATTVRLMSLTGRR